jgi:hypothetical protein
MSRTLVVLRAAPYVWKRPQSAMVDDGLCAL